MRHVDLPHLGLGEQVLGEEIEGVPGGFVVKVVEADVTGSGDAIGVATYVTLREGEPGIRSGG